MGESRGKEKDTKDNREIKDNRGLRTRTQKLIVFSVSLPLSMPLVF